MVRQCYMCKTYAHQAEGQHLSFHRLPVNPLTRKIWISALGFDEDYKFPKKVEICSNHFQQSDFDYRTDGQKYLKQGAVPLPTHSAFESLTRESSDSTVSPSPPEQEVELEDAVTVTSSSLENSPVKNRSPLPSIVSERHILNRTSSSSTATASEIEDRLIQQQDKKSVETTAPSTSMFKESTYLSINPKKRKRRYVGDFSSGDFSSPTKAKKHFHILKDTITTQRKKIRSLQTTVATLRKRVKTLNSLLKLLKEKSYITDSSETILKASLSGSALQIFERMLKGPSKQKYNPAIRAFALTLSFYSPKAYNFVRNTFNRSLPHLSTISKWYSSVDGSPGFTQEALNA